ncbi:hypothetical protein MUGA111182_17150 [Mucilaginibacter galii]|uniref:Uncharacterized protein n=1 Tax=Mucilaginibacter galii TaxID=2005073 RepID=A0A917J961_9SPHI|nr:hypothetical protein [Mucilaginibacter galii]GGI49751.1 hypothetical protein GCM10011425_09630 [Mucilaginibacter galii]
MKNSTKPSITKLVNRFDNELKAMLLEDLKNVRSAKNQLIDSIKQSISAKGKGLSAA